MALGPSDRIGTRYGTMGPLQREECKTVTNGAKNEVDCFFPSRNGTFCEGALIKALTPSNEVIDVR